MMQNNSDYLAVGDGHELFYECWGNPEGKKFIFIHGGPGGGCGERDQQFFDPEQDCVLFFDQRGSARSKPFGSLEANNTDHLVEDINKLLDHVGWTESVHFFGGSWGSTLILVYAIRYPERVRSMILRGIYLSLPEQYDLFMLDQVERFRPDAWAQLMELVPEDQQQDPSLYYAEMLQHEDPEVREKHAYAYSYYEISISRLASSAKENHEVMKNFAYESMAIMESHYTRQQCFLPDNYILDNTDKIAHIPTTIVHGMYDIVCLPIQAHMLHEKLENCELHMTVSGHSSSEPETKEKLQVAVRAAL